ncbi:MAG TPA: hypothetical protein VJ810_25445 [Blastocatellia bacterium]|nr:hypothetical protein [Blastocatellia bacterium]
MKTLGDNEELASARYAVELATIDCAELSLFIGEAQVATLPRGNFEFSVEWGKLIFAWWGEGVSQSWRVTAYEIDRGELRLRATRGMAREAAMLTLRDPARRLKGRRETRELEVMTLGERRKAYAKTLSLLITNNFDGARVQRVTVGPARSRSGTGRYARLVLKSSGQAVLVIGVSEAESQPRIDGVIAAGLVWLAAFNEKRDEEGRAKRLLFCLPKGRSQTAMERLTLLDVSHLGARIECFEVDECCEEMVSVRPVTQDELLNSHPREVIWPGASTPNERWRERIINLAPGLIETRRDARSGGERFEINGLEFARLSAGGQAKFGVAGLRSDGESNLVVLSDSSFGELECLAREIARYRSADCLDHRHPFYLLRAEAWLESLLRRDISRLDATFDERFIYAQIPAWRADERSVVDLLTINYEGRLVVIEIKAAEDPQLPLQGTDYWLRVEQGRLRNEFKKRGLFEDVVIADQSPLLYLVAPRLRFHRTFTTVARCVSPRIEAYRIGVNEKWREGVKVHTRERIN